jgi:hypothetical protein
VIMDSCLTTMEMEIIDVVVVVGGVNNLPQEALYCSTAVLLHFTSHTITAL